MQDPPCAWTREAVRELAADAESCGRENLPQESNEAEFIFYCVNLGSISDGRDGLTGWAVGLSANLVCSRGFTYH